MTANKALGADPVFAGEGAGDGRPRSGAGDNTYPMSKGPGRIEAAIIELFKSTKDRALSVTQLELLSEKALELHRAPQRNHAARSPNDANAHCSSCPL
jgi:hypothetical protein